MKVFLDANILVSVLNKEYPLFTYSSRVLSLAGQQGFRICTSPLCLAIAYYSAEKKSGASRAKEKINLLCNNLEITTVDHDCAESVLSNQAVNDFEDGLEYYSAEKAGCSCIITEDLNDFYFSSIEVTTARYFLEKHVFDRLD